MKPLFGVVTTTRAEYGIFRPLLKEFQHRGVLFELYVTGSHLLASHGMTITEISADGFDIAECVDIVSSGDDSPVTAGRTMGQALAAFSELLSRRRPSLLFLLGDRFETMAIAAAAQLVNVPVAHLHGGERTEGLVDEAFRHSITKMSHLHFVSVEDYRRRVIQMGERPDSVFCVGALGLDNLSSVEWLDRDALEKELDFLFLERNVLLTYHPVTLDSGKSSLALRALLDALDEYPDLGIIITLPNLDPGSEALRNLLLSYQLQRKNRVKIVNSLGTRRYFSMLRVVDAVVGNSSSGLIEVPSFGIPTVNIGDRQKGRIFGESVLNCGVSRSEISTALSQALSEEMKAKARVARNPYGDGNSAKKIANILENMSLPISMRKPFWDQS